MGRREIFREILVKPLKERSMTEPLIIEIFSDYV